MNYFNELHEKGITNIELSAEELQELLLKDRITVEQFTKVMINNLGEKEFWKTYNSCLKSIYKKGIE